MKGKRSTADNSLEVEMTCNRVPIDWVSEYDLSNQLSVNDRDDENQVETGQISDKQYAPSGGCV